MSRATLDERLASSSLVGLGPRDFLLTCLACADLTDDEAERLLSMVERPIAEQMRERAAKVNERCDECDGTGIVLGMRCTVCLDAREKADAIRALPLEEPKG